MATTGEQSSLVSQAIRFREGDKVFPFSMLRELISFHVVGICFSHLQGSIQVT